MKIEIEQAAANVGITAFITNSDERIETQLNRLTGIENLPILLISWDIETNLTFDDHGFLNNPTSSIVCLLMTKAIDTSKNEMEKSAEEMGVLFQRFIQELHSQLIPYQRAGQNPITGANYKLVPNHGAGKHSGVLGRFIMSIEVNNC